MALLEALKKNLGTAADAQTESIKAAIVACREAMLAQSKNGEDRFQWAHQSSRVMAAVAEHFKKNEGIEFEQRDGLLVFEWPK